MKLTERANHLWKEQLPGRSDLQLSHELAVLCQALEERLVRMEEAINRFRDQIEGHID